MAKGGDKMKSLEFRKTQQGYDIYIDSDDKIGEIYFDWTEIHNLHQFRSDSWFTIGELEQVIAFMKSNEHK